jgi:hypothetical protein
VVMQQGFPLDELLRLALRHAQGVEQVTDAAIELFDRFVRKAGGDPEAVADAFRRLLPAVTTLVALHFQRTLLNRALARLRQAGDHAGLEATAAVLRDAHLEVKWR